MSNIPRVVETGDAVTIMPFSGIQFFEADLDLEKHRTLRREFWEEPGTRDGAKIAKLKRVAPDTASRDFVVIGESRVVSGEEVYSIRSIDAFETYDRTWIPVPIFRIHEQPRGRATEFMSGPTTWARLYIAKLDQPDDRGNTHRLVFALDTALTRRRDQAAGAPYLTPTDSDSEEQKSFTLVDDPDRIAFFANLPYVDPWLDEVFQSARDAKLIALGRDPKKRDTSGLPRVCEHWARYLTLLDVIGAAVKMPNFVMAGTMSAHQGEPPVKVDLVLDIGNSRTCGILIERHADGGHPTLNNSYPLELRDLSRPERVYREPFESRVEFSKADFGSEQIANRAGRNNAFVWQSMVRTGPEAVDLCISAKGGEGATGLSSPKRYLWDDAAQAQLWRFNMSLSRHKSGSGLAVESPIMAYVAEDGRVLSTLSPKLRATVSEAFEPHFSRCSLFTFMLQEVLQHAFCQINAISNRARRSNTSRVRILDKIVLTLPPGMPLPERRIFQDRAKAAVQLMWDCLSTYDEALFSAKTRPTVVEPYDEASSTQIVYLYGEMLRLQNGISDLFSTQGRERTVTETADGKTTSNTARTLRMASIDIGGGTTDLMIITHELRYGSQVVPHQNFRESFRLAGDDILREIINLNVLPSIEAYARTQGIADPRELTGRVFGADHAGMTEPERQRRRQLVTEVIVPIGLSILKGCESGGTEPRVITQKQVAEFFTDRAPLSAHVLSYIDGEARRLGAPAFSLLDAPITVDLAASEELIFNYLGGILADLAEVIRDLDCDLVLLSGRPSRLPVVREILLAHLPVSPDRLVSMSDYRVGNWYPFRNHLGQISDPKTTTAVGAALTWLALGDLGGIRFESRNLQQRSTARFIGKLEEASGKLRDVNVVIGNLDLDAAPPPRGKAAPAAATQPKPIVMPQRLMLGYRQMPIERWPAMPLYELSFASTEQTTPSYVTIARDERASGARDDDDAGAVEDFVIEDVQPLRPDQVVGRMPGKRDIIMKLQTLPNRNGYWLDTGVIKD